jgi:energy-coupling factor transporter transmembrane protein EcfT
MRSASMDLNGSEVISLLELFNVISFIVFTVLLIAVFIRMFYRLGGYLFNREKVPLLLKRDVLLFGVLAVILGLILMLRVFGDDGLLLRTSPVWMVASGLAANLAMGYWAYVEYFRVEED